MNKRLKFAKEQRKKYPQIAFIHPSVKIPEWVEVRKNVIIHENCTIGTEGFGFVRDNDGKWIHIPHSGKVIIGDDVEIFPGTNVDRATVDETTIGRGTKIDHHCHIGHNSQIGKNCVITAQVLIGGSAIIGNNVWIGPHSTILNKVKIGNNVYIGSHTNVLKDVEDNSVVVGNPGKVIRIGNQPHIDKNNIRNLILTDCFMKEDIK